MARPIMPENRNKPYQFTSFQCRRDLHRRLKLACSLTDSTMAQIINRAIELYLMRVEPRMQKMTEKAMSSFPNLEVEEEEEDEEESAS